jgi:transcriptional regulator with XRE-family HTH domain
MDLLADNLKYLRAQKNISQQVLAEALIITRGSYAKYEDGTREPSIEVIKRISHYFHISIDILVSVDLRKISIDQLLKMDDNRILLPITVDRQGKDYIEIIPHKARAGYLSGYSDPEFIENLQHIALPFLSKAKYRAFPVQGDSMPPHKEGSFIVGKYLEKISAIQDGKTYIILSKSEGIVYKRVYRKNKKENTLLLHSDNPIYKPYEIKPQEILEIWEYAASIATKEFQPEDLNYESVRDMFRQLRMEIKAIAQNNM